MQSIQGMCMSTENSTTGKGEERIRFVKVNQNQTKKKLECNFQVQVMTDNLTSNFEAKKKQNWLHFSHKNLGVPLPNK